MTFFRLLTAATVIATPATLVAEVVDAAAGGFTVEHEMLIAADRSATWHAAVNEVGEWWNPDHTVAGDAKRMRIDPRPLGCFCEYLGDSDGVVHLTVTTASTDVLLRMTGGLGPLGLMGVNGNLTWEFFDDVAGTRVRFTYAVGGYRTGGLDELAGPVDRVIGEALVRLKTYAEAD
ncbi:MAG: hypothetical protein R3288_03965 [Woeseiaceae bacterium]|nr:hypothetical protein [Woeseiaceae bacterium]